MFQQTHGQGHEFGAPASELAPSQEELVSAEAEELEELELGAAS